MQKRQVKASQHGRCGRCLKPHEQLQVHHVNGDWRDNRMVNLIALCPDCHREADAQVRAARDRR